MGKISRTVLTSLLLLVVGFTVVAVAAWQAIYNMPNNATGPNQGEGGGGETSSIQFILEDAPWVNNTPVEWDVFTVGRNVSKSFKVLNNGLSNVTVTFAPSNVPSGWVYGTNMSGVVVPSKKQVNGTIWLKCVSGFGAISFNSTITVAETP